MGKIGQCKKCPKDSRPTRLMGDGVCAYHLAHPEDDQSKERQKKEVEKLVITERQLREFYRLQFEQRTEFCENGCGKRLTDPLELWRQKAMVCHILPKNEEAGFPSVALHPDNRWFGCWDCHTQYDRSWADAIRMPVWQTCVERFVKFMHAISVGEHRRLPEPLRDIIDASFGLAFSQSTKI